MNRSVPFVVFWEVTEDLEKVVSGKQEQLGKPDAFVPLYGRNTCDEALQSQDAPLLHILDH